MTGTVDKRRRRSAPGTRPRILAAAADEFGAHGFAATTVDRIADKLIGLRYFADAEGRTNLAIADVGGAFLVVSQFTLYADVSRGRRPGFTLAALPEHAIPLVDRLVERLRDAGAPVKTGRFGAEMQVELVNDGPFTLVLDSQRDLA